MFPVVLEGIFLLLSLRDFFTFNFSSSADSLLFMIHKADTTNNSTGPTVRERSCFFYLKDKTYFISLLTTLYNFANLKHVSTRYSFLTTQSRIIGAVRGAHSQLWGTIIPVCSLYAARKYDRRFGTPAIVWFTGWN